MDSTGIPVYGEQENSAYSGRFESTCHHPLLLFNREGDCLATKPRPGNPHSADDWEEMLLPEIERQQRAGKEVVFRADAAFAKPEIYEALEARGVRHAIRIPANDSLERDIAELPTRPVGRPSHKPVVWYKSFSIRRRVGRQRGGWWPSWSSTSGSCSRGPGVAEKDFEADVRKTVRIVFGSAHPTLSELSLRYSGRRAVGASEK